MRLRIDLAYDGTEFSGWATQPGLRTVQETLETAIGRTLRVDPAPVLAVAGRTDAGVHARAQVAHIDIDDELQVAFRDDLYRGPDALSDYLARRLRRVLPPDVAVHEVRPAPAGFDARFSAIWRRYCYRIWDSESRPDPLARHQTASTRKTLNPDLMTAAGQTLLGLHNFAAFCKPRAGATTIRTLTEVSVRRSSDPSGTIECWVQADAFCHSMVRSLVGALTEIGHGRQPTAWLTGMLAAEKRQSTIPVLPAAGLCLEQVGYPADEQLAERATEARNRRDQLIAERDVPADPAAVSESAPTSSGSD